MHTEDNMEDRLWDLIDGVSSTAEKTAVEALIAANAEWKRKYSELMEVHQLMTSSQLDEPSMRFTRNVMEEIARYHVAPATKSYINKNVIRGIGAFFLSMITALIVFFVVQVNLAKGSTTVGPDVKLPSFDVKAPAVDLGKALGSLPVMLFMFITVVMGLVLLDLYLQRKRGARAGAI